MVRNKGEQRAEFAPDDEFNGRYMFTPRANTHHVVPEGHYYEQNRPRRPTFRAPSRFEVADWSFPQYTGWLPHHYTSPQFTQFTPSHANGSSRYYGNGSGSISLPGPRRANPSRSNWEQYIQATPRDDYLRRQSREYRDYDYGEEVFARYARDHGRDERTEQPQPTFSRYVSEAGPAAEPNMRQYQASDSDEAEELEVGQECTCAAFRAEFARIDDEIAAICAKIDMLLRLKRDGGKSSKIYDGMGLW